jgi:hypothetical protein
LTDVPEGFIALTMEAVRTYVTSVNLYETTQSTIPEGFYLQLLPPNVVVEWLTLLLCIREVPGSKLGPGDQLS